MRRYYIKPYIKVNDYISRNGLMIGADPGETTSIQLAKPHEYSGGSINDGDCIQESVWDVE